MEQAIAADISTVKQVAVTVEIQSPGVAPAFAKELEAMRDRMIAPDTLLELNAPDVSCHRASLAAVEPAVRSPGQGVGHRMGVLHAETGEQHFRIAIWNVVAISIRIKKQIGRLKDENTTMTKSYPAGQI